MRVVWHHFYRPQDYTAYCAHRCANLAYKDRVRKKRIQEFHLKHDVELKPNSQKEFLTPTEVAAFLGVGRTSIYRYIKNAEIKAVRFDGKTLVRRSDIDKMFDYIIASNNENKPKEKNPISDFYTTAEVKEKYGVKDSWIFHIAKEHNIPRTFHRGKTYWSKKHIDDYFAKKAPDPENQGMVQHTRHAGEVRHDANGHLFFCIKECHSQEEGWHHGVLLQETCGHCQRPYSSQRT